MKNIYFAILLCTSAFTGHAAKKAIAPPVTATITGNATVCQNTAAPQITFTGGGGATPYTFTYHINSGPAQTVTTTGTNTTATIPASTATAGSFIYTLDSVHDGTPPNTEQLISGQSITVNINPQPNANLGGTGSGSNFGGIPVFRVCSNTASLFNFTNTSTSSNTNYTIDWGDSSPNFTGTLWTTLSHTYQIGLWNLTYTIQGSNGCSITKPYIVFVGSNPAVSLGNPGNTDICSANTLTFPITGTTNNPPGTTYTVTFNDSSSPQVFNHPPPSSVSHTFINSSCGTTSSDGSNSYPNSFSANIVATNPCSTSSVGVVPIYVSQNPQADFTGPAKGCTGIQTCFTNTSLGNQVISNVCSAPPIIWLVVPSTGFTITSGSLGNDFSSTDPNLWLPGSGNLCLNFNTPGTYSISVKTGNKCGIDVETKTICIEPPLLPQFTLSPNSGCVPLAVSTTNTTNLANQCSPPTYNWTITYASGNCGAVSAYTYTSGTTAASASPSFNFTEAGTYSIKLTTTNSCGNATSAIQTVTVKKPPTVNVNPIANFCQNVNLTASAVVNTCSSGPGTSYLWTFTGGTPPTATSATPPTVTYSTAGTYTVSLAVTNECGTTTATSNSFNVMTSPMVQNAALTVCSGTAFTLTPSNSTAGNSIPAGTTYSWPAPVVTGGITGGAAGAIQSAISGTLTNNSASVQTATYTITPKVGTCPGVTFTLIVSVNPAPLITNQPVSSSVCIGGVPQLLSVTLNSSAVTPTYQWYSNTTNSNTGGTIIPGATSTIYNPPATTAGTLYYYCVISLASGGCTSITSNTANVTVTPPASFVTQPLASQNLCVGVTIPTALTTAFTGGTGTPSYQWYSNTNNSNTGGTPIGGATESSYTPPLYAAAGNYFYYVVLSLNGNGCGPVASAVAAINVFSDPVVNTQPLASQTLCQGATASTLEVIATGGNGTFSYQWYSNSSNNTTSGTAIAGATNSTYIPNLSTVGSLFYYCIITQNTAGCSVISATASVIVNAAPTITTQPASSTVCSGGSPAQMSVTYINGVGTPAYQWYSNAANNTTTGSVISGATNAIFTPPAVIVGTTYYYCIITLPLAGGCSSIASNTATVTVTPGAAISSQPLATQSLCVGGTLSLPLAVSYTGGTGTASYQWYSNTSNSNTGGVLIAGANASGYTPPVFSSAGTFYYYVVITLNGNGCGPVTSDIAAINVVADPLLSVQPLATQTVCQTATPASLSITATGGIGTYAYQWYSSTSNNTASGTPIAGATNDTYLPPTLNVGTTYYYCLISQPSGNGCGITSAIAEVIVNLAPTFTNQPVSSTVCLGGIPTPLSVSYTNGVGIPSYQWFSNTTNNNTAGAIISGETNTTFTPPGTIVGTVFYYCIITLPAAGGCSSIVSDTATVTITPTATINMQPTTTQNICVGGTISLPLTANYMGGTGTPSYQWYSNTSNSNTGGTVIPAATAPGYTPPAFAAPGNYYYYVVISLSGNGCGTATSNVAEVAVVPDPVVPAQPLVSQTLCQNATPTALSVTASGGVGASYNYQWYSSPTNSTISGTPLTGETNSIFTPPTSNAGTVYYYCEITQGAGLACNATSDIAAVNVNLAPAIANQPTSSTVCVNQPATALSVTYMNGVGTPNYQWFSNTINSNIGGTPISGANTASYVAATTTAGIFYYYCEIVFPTLAGDCQIITSNLATVTVNDNPIIANTSTTICSATIFIITPSSGGGNIVPATTTYTWSAPVINPAGSISGAGAMPTVQTNISQTLVNLTTGPATVTYTVTPTAGVCQGPNFEIVVTVNPAINPNIVATNNLCFGVNSASITTNVTGGIPFSSGSPYLYSWTGPGSFSSAAASISNVLPGSYSLVIQDAGGCPFSNTYVITEPADIAITNDSESDVTCFGAADGTINITINGGTGAYAYTWTKNGTYYASIEDLSNLSPGTYILTVTDANNCGPKTATFNITEPMPLVASLTSQTNVICYGASTGAITVNVSGGTIGTGYNYSWTGPGTFNSSSQNLTNIAAGIYTLTVTDANGCTKSLSVTITQSTEIQISYTTTPITCYGADNASIAVVLSGGNAPYTFQWSNLATALSQTNLGAGNYAITVTDSFGCVKMQTINIPQAPIFVSNPIVSQITCFGAHNGSINLNLTGGIAPVALSWTDGSTAGLIRNNLGAGIYTATISDGTPCYITKTFTIIEPQPIVLGAVLTNAFGCTNPNTGAIDLLPSGGTPPYTFSWSNGATTEDLNAITSGNYLVNVTDTNGCTKSAQYSITRPDPIAIDVTTDTNFDCALHKVQQNFIAAVSGGVPPYQLQWSSGTVSGVNHQIMHSDANGTVVLTVTDVLGCTANYTVTVDNPVLGYTAFEPTSFGYTSFGIYSIGDPIQFNSHNTGDFVSVSWDFGDGTFSTELNPTHTYVNPRNYIVTQTVTYPFGCVYVQTISLIIEQGYMIVVPNAFTPNGDRLNDNFRPVTKRLTNVHLDVYDTWGSVIYSENGDVLVGWDGKVKDKNAENGNYYCKVSGDTFYGTTINENHPFVLIK